MAKLGMNLSDVKPEDNNFQALPKGEYDVVCESSEIKQTKSKTGYYLNLKFKVINNEKFKNRVIFDIINLKNDNPKAQEIGLARLKRILEISKLPTDGTADTDNLIGKVFKCYIKVEQQEMGESNRIASYDQTNAQFTQEKMENNIPDGWL